MVPKLGSHACSHLELPDELSYKDDCTIYDPTKRASNSLSVFSFENPRSSVFPNRSPIISHPHVFEEQEIIAYSLFFVCKMLNYTVNETRGLTSPNVSITWAVQNKVAKSGNCEVGQKKIHKSISEPFLFLAEAEPRTQIVWEGDGRHFKTNQYQFHAFFANARVYTYTLQKNHSSKYFCNSGKQSEPRIRTQSHLKRSYFS